MTSVSWQMPAKVNLALTVGPLRADGYHPVATVLHAISVADVVTATANDASATASVTVAAAHPAVDVAGVPQDATNLAVRAVHTLATHLGRPPAVALHIEKAIPVAGGLAGGSVDAAGALLACNDLWEAGLSTADLRRVAAELGSDVPFAVGGATALGAGRGEVLEPVPVGGELYWVVVAGEGGLSAATVYRRLDELRAAGRVSAPSAILDLPRELLEGLATGDVGAVARALSNDLEAAALDLAPELGATLTAGRAAGALAGMVSGSGPTCVFLAPDRGTAEAIAQTFERDGYAGRVMTAIGPREPQRVVGGP